MKLTAPKCAVELDGSGRAIAFENKLTGEIYPITDRGEYVLCGGERIASGDLVSATQREDGAELIYENFRVRWVIRGCYLEKTVIFTAPQGLTVDQVCVMDYAYPDAADVHFHDDCTIWHCPMCTYARHGKGGVFYGLAYPYWDDDFAMTFSPWIALAEGETLVSEKAFIGATELTGKTTVSHGPYHGQRKQKYFDMFQPERTGLNQHFEGFKIPDDAGIPDEVQDVGEVRAMREFFREYLGEFPLPEDGYYVWQNGWWAGLNKPDTSYIDVMEKIGVRDIMTAAMYLGHANHPCCEPPYIKDARIDPLGFPAIAGEGARITTLADGHHHSESAAAEDSAAEEYTDEFAAPPAYDEMIRYAAEKGIRVCSFSTPNNSYTKRPDWHSLGEDGSAHEYFGTKLSCFACDEYMEHHLKVLYKVLDRYSPGLWCFDGRWMGFKEIGGYYDRVEEDPCYSSDHGHLPGKSRYREWKNIEEFKRRLRERYPRMCLEQYYGMKRASTWGLTQMNSDENYYETSGADDTRFQTWHNENDRFRPTYMHFTNLMAKTPEEFRYSLISAISTSAYMQIANGYDLLRDSEECVEFFKKWRAWAGENARYLRDRVNLFGCPGDVKIDGSAHILDGEGWVFLFNVMDTDEVCDLDLTEIPGLDGEYTVSEIYPAEKSHGTAPAHGAIRIPMEKRSAAIIRLSRVK